MSQAPSIYFLYTNIGRGHPFYLDGIIEALACETTASLSLSSGDVFEICRGLSRRAWVTARWLYRQGSSSEGAVGRLYRLLRQGSDYNTPSRTMTLLGRDLRRRFGDSSEPLVVGHPILVGILRDRPNLIYQHGEVVTPSEAVVSGAERVLVPTAAAAEPFVEGGYRDRQVEVTGLCIEPSLVAQAGEAYQARASRLNGTQPLTGLFISSGAEPNKHVETIISSATSALRAGSRAVVLARSGGKLDRAISQRWAKSGLEYARYATPEETPDDAPPGLLVAFSTRRQENDWVGRWFRSIDYFVGPPHERTNWALGLGLPMFALTPTVGPFAPMNLELLLGSGTARTFQTEAEVLRFGDTLNELRTSGRLAAMARLGWGKFDIGGFEKIARFLVQHYAQ